MNHDQLTALFALQRVFPGMETKLTGNRHLGGVKMNELVITIPLKTEQAEWWMLAQHLMAPADEFEGEDDDQSYDNLHDRPKVVRDVVEETGADIGQTDEHGTRTDGDTGYVFYPHTVAGGAINVIPDLNGRDAERFARDIGRLARYRELFAIGNKPGLYDVLRRHLTRDQFSRLADMTDAALIVLILKIERLEEASNG